MAVCVSADPKLDVKDQMCFLFELHCLLAKVRIHILNRFKSLSTFYFFRGIWTSIHGRQRAVYRFYVYIWGSS